MANQFLVEIHDFITGRLESARKACEEARSREDRGKLRFHEGRLDELGSLRAFLSEHFDLDTQNYY